VARQSTVEIMEGHLESQLALAASHPSRKLPSERELCDMFGVSRTVVREALRSFQHRGLLEVHPGRGMFAVQDVNAPVVRAVEHSLRHQQVSLDAILEGRLLLETHIAEIAAERRTTVQLDLMRRDLSEMKRNFYTIPEFQKADRRFHLALADATHNRLYSIWLQPIIAFLESRSRGVEALGEVRERILSAHAEIFEGVKAKDAPRARTAMTRHLLDFDEYTKMAIRAGMLPPTAEVSVKLRAKPSTKRTTGDLNVDSVRQRRKAPKRKG
jgi:GntR family transcriptional repressor for pyruvate dehydrogenase complex